MTTPPRAATARRLALGAYGERLAAQHLVEQGLVVLDRNWRCDAGEIDLVLREGAVLVICEVKTRSSDACGTPHEAVTPAKLERRGTGIDPADLGHLGGAGIAGHQFPGDIGGAQAGQDPAGRGIGRPRRGASTVDHVAGLV